MIISHEHQYIFIKTNKTAGTSVELLLSKYCGPKDIITPLPPEDERTRKQISGQSPRFYRSSLTEYGLKDIGKLLIRGERKLRFYNHIAGIDVKTRIGETIWNTYTKFCIERNPWDRVISHYFWCNRKPGVSMSFDDYIKSQKIYLLKKKGCNLYTIDNAVAVDHIIRFEDLHAGLDSLRDKLGLPASFELPRAKSQYRKDKRSYRDVLGAQERDLIAEIFADEIANFGYTF